MTLDETSRARLLGKRITLVAFIALSVVFVVASSLQIIPAVFGAWVTPIAASPPGTAPRRCADGIRSMAVALDRAADAAGSPSFDARLQPEWGQRAAVEDACSQSPAGVDAWAALARMRSAEEQLTPRTGTEMAPLRRAVFAHLPAN